MFSLMEMASSLLWSPGSLSSSLWHYFPDYTNSALSATGWMLRYFLSTHCTFRCPHLLFVSSSAKDALTRHPLPLELTFFEDPANVASSIMFSIPERKGAHLFSFLYTFSLTTEQRQRAALIWVSYLLSSRTCIPSSCLPKPSLRSY